MIKLKENVRPYSLLILAAVANISEEKRITWITSGNDSNHMTGSLHYFDRALDIRSKDFLSYEDKIDFLVNVLQRLGKNVKAGLTNNSWHTENGYYGLLENQDKDNEHIHIEYDPKVGISV